MRNTASIPKVKRIRFRSSGILTMPSAPDMNSWLLHGPDPLAHRIRDPAQYTLSRDRPGHAPAPGPREPVALRPSSFGLLLVRYRNPRNWDQLDLASRLGDFFL